MAHREEVANLIKNGAEVHKNCKILSVIEPDYYIQADEILRIKIDSKIKATDYNEGEVENKETNTFIVDAYSVHSCLEQNANTAFIADCVWMKPTWLTCILSHAIIDVATMKYDAGEEYFKFGTDIDHIADETMYVSYITNIVLDTVGIQFLDKIRDMIIKEDLILNLN